MKRIGIGWALGTQDGEGRYGLALASQMARRGRLPSLLHVAESLELDVRQAGFLASALAEYAACREIPAPGQRLSFPVLQMLGDRLINQACAEGRPGNPDIGLAGFSNVDIPRENIERVSDWPLIVTSSSWATQVLRGRGLRNLYHCPPGVDLERFHPAPRTGLFPGRFVVFSGGELEYRQGQDILLGAFRIFQQRHPEALLVCGWSCLSVDGLSGLLNSPYLDGLPERVRGVVQLSPWLARNGIAPHALLDLSLVPGSQLPDILRECDLAVFPSRCEGGMQWPALQAMACGVPTIVAANTGYLDLLGEHVYMLQTQGELARQGAELGLEGWGESSQEELLELMERAYTRRTEATIKGQAAAQFMANRGLDSHTRRLLTALDQVVGGTALASSEIQDDYNWGLCLHRAGRLGEAERLYDAVLRRQPEHAGARADRGNARRDLGDLQGAEADFRTFLAARPGNPRALHSLGNLLRRDGRVEEAATCLRQALRGMQSAALHWDLAFTLLLLGRYREAWPHFEKRHEALGLRTAAPDKPRWDGQRVLDSTLLVLDEQGLGDTLQFLRFLTLIPRGPGGRVIFAGKPATLTVVQQMLPAADVYAWDQPLPRSQAWIPLMSLPMLLGVQQPQDIPAPCPVPLLDDARVARWRTLVRGRNERPVVALCWRGNPDFSGDKLRSPGLAVLRSLLEVEGVSFVSVQVGAGRLEIGELGLAEQVCDVGAAIEAAGAEVLDTLAVLQSCDFVVSSCTSVLHMAGLLCRPGLGLLCRQPDWRWMLQRADTPWYPSLRLIRQDGVGDWRGVAREAAAQLCAWRDSQVLKLDDVPF
jgi:glycosyltransferase involved in cell wall biosynthesis